MKPVSVLITCKNEEHHIKDLLESLRWADEILIVDSFSDDQTLAIAASYPTTIFQRPYQSPADQKNWAIPKARNEWVFILDADERVPNALADEILRVVAQNPTESAFWVRRSNFFMGKKIKFSGWQGDKVMRLIRRDDCRYNQKQVHEEIETHGKVAVLKEKIEHHTFKNVTHFLQKTDRYARWSAQDVNTKTPTITAFHLFLKPFFRFLKHYLLRGGFLDGKEGFIISVLMAWGVFLRYFYLMELKKQS